MLLNNSDSVKPSQCLKIHFIDNYWLLSILSVLVLVEGVHLPSPNIILSNVVPTLVLYSHVLGWDGLVSANI